MYPMPGNERMMLKELEREAARLAAEVAAGREAQAVLTAQARRAAKWLTDWLRGAKVRIGRPRAAHSPR